MFKKMVRIFIVARTASVLAELTDKQLSDIGINRSEIYTYAEKINA